MDALQPETPPEERRIIELYDASPLIGLRVTIVRAAIETTDEAGEKYIEMPNIETAAAASAVVRCLMPIRLRGSEIRAIRKITGLTAKELAARMDTNTSPETISRWENERQPMGGYAEKVFRLVICEHLSKEAPGIEYKDGAIARLNVVDPWKTDASYQVPPITLECVRMLSSSHDIVQAWGTEHVAA